MTHSRHPGRPGTWALIAMLIAALAPACDARGRNGEIATRPAAQSVPGADPKLNEPFVDPELAVDEWIGRFEVESREVFAASAEVLAAMGIARGDRIADVGAGTGLYTRLFADAVGEAGWVYAVDISPVFIEHINRSLQNDGVRNVTGVLSRVDSIMLPPGSVDRVFVCDTYHHFETPTQTMASIHRALKPHGELVVIDFDRVPGVSREFILGHVRAGKEVFRAEIEAAGFDLIADVPIAGFQENYLLRFRKR